MTSTVTAVVDREPPRSRSCAAPSPRQGKKTVEVAYLITSNPDASQETLAAWVRGRWEIENKLHWAT